MKIWGKVPNLAVTHHKRWVIVFYGRELLRRIAQAYKGILTIMESMLRNGKATREEYRDIFSHWHK